MADRKLVAIHRALFLVEQLSYFEQIADSYAVLTFQVSDLTNLQLFDKVSSFVHFVYFYSQA